MLKIQNLHVSVEGKEILRGFSLELQPGEIHALMGPNGSGKSTLASALMGNPKYKITKGKIFFKGKDITKTNPTEKAKLGIFLSFQNPIEVPGVNFRKFLRQAYNSLNPKSKLSVLEFNDRLKKKAKELDIEETFLSRYLNQGFSGGEKKKAEILQLLVLDPCLVVLDETDSGLDIDSLKLVASGINSFVTSGKKKTALVITHYQRILQYLKPNHVSVMLHGKVVASGGSELAEKLEKKGYGWVK